MVLKDVEIERHMPNLITLPYPFIDILIDFADIFDRILRLI
jgi:hypothetical protein